MCIQDGHVMLLRDVLVRKVGTKDHERDEHEQGAVVGGAREMKDERKSVMVRSKRSHLLCFVLRHGLLLRPDARNRGKSLQTRTGC